MQHAHKGFGRKSGTGDPIAHLRRFGERTPFLRVLALFVLAVLLVNPFRELITEDDAWAYARSVHALLETGEYRLDQWSAANMPAQIYLAAALARLFGYSLTLLRLTSVGLLLIAAWSMCGLLADIGCARRDAATLSLGLLASPLVLYFAFSFVTDVQFLAWLLLALLLYGRGISRASVVHMVLASCAAAAAIGTRQFGVAILPAIIVACVVCREARPRQFALLISGLLLPMTAAVWQLAAEGAPTFTQAVRLAELKMYLAQPLHVLVVEGIWRTGTILLYLAVLLFPLLPVIGWLAARYYRVAATAGSSVGRLYVVFGCMVLLLAITPLLSRMLVVIEQGSVTRPALLPSLPWLAPKYIQYGGIRFALTIGGIAAAAMLVWIGLCLWWFRAKSWKLSPNLVMASVTVAGLLALHCLYVQMNDTYLIPFVPFAILLVGAAVASSRIPTAWMRSCAMFCLAFVVMLTVWMRGDFDRQTAAWSAANWLSAQGADRSRTASPLTWDEYYGAFDDWLAEVTAQTGRLPDPLAYAGRFHAVYFRWFIERGQAARWAVTSFDWFDERNPGPWVILRRFHYRDTWLRDRIVYALVRRP